MALTKEDISIQGTGGYGTLSYTPEPGENIEGTAGDIAAETATSGIVSSDASAELAGQAPNIVVPVNQSSDSDSDNIINTVDEGLMEVPGQGITSQVEVTNKLNLNPADLLTKQNAIALALGIVNPIAALAYRYYTNQQAKKAIERQAAVDTAETARLADTPANVGRQIDFETGEITGSPTGDVNIYDEVALTSGQYTPTNQESPSYIDPAGPYPEVRGDNEFITYQEPEPTYTAPPAYQGSPAYSGSDGDGDSGGQSSSQSGADAAQDDESAGYGGYAVGGIVRLRKNKQNSRIHDRRKRLAMGGIASLHGQNNTGINISVKGIQSTKCSIFKQRFRCCTTKT